MWDTVTHPSYVNTGTPTATTNHDCYVHFESAVSDIKSKAATRRDVCGADTEKHIRWNFPRVSARLRVCNLAKQNLQTIGIVFFF